VLAVKDSGIGMNKQMQERIFEPFFTTKGVGKGTGLGLSVVYGIVKQSGGFITVDSYPGRGTEFRIYLPVVFEIPQPVLDTEDRPIHGGSETILLVEDEPVLRQKLRKLLEESGYQVLVASDGDQAHRLALLDTERFHLLLTDVVMPGSSGHRLAERLLTLCPQMKVLYMSGYPDPSDGNITLQLQPSFIQKPFTRDRLLRRVRELLDL
jgi:CheY-like chemotaxis protein